MKKVYLSLGSLFLAIILNACYIPPSYLDHTSPLEKLEALDASGGILDSYLEELSLYEDQTLVDLFYELSDRVKPSDETLIEEDKQALMLQASVLEIEYRNLKLTDETYILVLEWVHRFACSPWQRLSLNLTPVKAFGTGASDGAYDVFIDHQDNIYIVGSTEGHLAKRNAGAKDAFVCKYDANGRNVWAKQFGTHDFDDARGVAVNESGTIFVVGRAGNMFIPEESIAAHGNKGAYIKALDANGNDLWTDQFGSSIGSWGEDVALSRSGDPAITGRNYGQNYVRSYTKHGHLKGEALFSGSKVEDIDVSDEGRIWVVGWDSSQSYTLSFVRTFTEQAHALTYDSFGVKTIHKTVKAQGIRVDAHENAYIAGFTNAAFGERNFGGTDAFVLKFRAGQGVDWINQFGTSRDDRAHAVDLHASNNNLFVAGSTTGDLAGQNVALRDVFLNHYSTAGSLQNSRQVGTTADELLTSLATNSAQEAVLVGVFMGNGIDAFAAWLP